MAQHKILAIVLAAGQGKRMGLVGQNKTTVELAGKPIIARGIENISKIANKIIVVVGNESESVISALKSYPDIIFVEQANRLGTGHAVKCALGAYEENVLAFDSIIIAMGDHMSFYKSADFQNLVDSQRENSSAISLVTTIDENASLHGYGRIIRNENGLVEAIVEQKNATEAQLKINEVNVALYCFDRNFLLDNIEKIQINKLTGEYYITDLVSFAKIQNLKIVPVLLPASSVGIGINSTKDLEEARKLLES